MNITLKKALASFAGCKTEGHVVDMDTCPYCEIARLRAALEKIAAGETQYGMNAIAREALEERLTINAETVGMLD